jgi:hypothetical protein
MSGYPSLLKRVTAANAPHKLSPRRPTVPTMTTLSLCLNVAVLVPVCGGLLADARWTQTAFGGRTPARGILLSVYGAILVVSAVLLVSGQTSQAVPLLWTQVVYKVTTPFSVGTLRNPVVVSNLGIAAFHLATLAAP